MSDDFLDNIFGLSDGSTVTVSETKEYESSRGKFALFPDGTSVKAALEEAKWVKDDAGRERLSLRWSVLAPEEYENRKVFQNLWIKDLDPNEVKRGEDKAIAKRDRQRMMFAHIDANAGGKIAEMYMKRATVRDEHLTEHLTNKPMVIRIDLMVPKTGDPMNFVAKISPKSAPVSTSEEIAKGAAEVAGMKKTSSSSSSSRDLSDEIPF